MGFPVSKEYSAQTVKIRWIIFAALCRKNIRSVLFLCLGLVPCGLRWLEAGVGFTFKRVGPRGSPNAMRN